MARTLSGNLRIAPFSEWDYFFLVSNLRHASFLGCSGFIYHTADGGPGDPVLLRHFRQAQAGKAVSHNSSPVNVKRRTASSRMCKSRSARRIQEFTI
jgi:hypothetical protein